MGDNVSVWKAVERRIANWWGTERTPLSGQSSRHTHSDTLHQTLYIEVKQRKTMGIFNIFRDTEKKAKKEGKIPVVCLQEKNKKGFLVVMKSTDIEQIIREKEALE